MEVSDIDRGKAAEARRLREKFGIPHPGESAIPNPQINPIDENKKAEARRLREKFGLSEPSEASGLKKTSTVGEDIAALGRGAKNIAGKAWEGAKNIAEHPGEAAGKAWQFGKGVASHPGQLAAGALPAAASILDIPALAYNALGVALPEYLAEKATGYERPAETKSGRLPYFGEKIGTGIANMLAGEPKTQEEKNARGTGSVITSLVPTSVAKTGLKAIETISKIPGAKKGYEIAEAVVKAPAKGAGNVIEYAKEITPKLPKKAAEKNLLANIGTDAKEALSNQESARRMGLTITPAEATGNPLLSAQEAAMGTSKEGALMQYEHANRQIAAQEKAIDKVLGDVHPDSTIVNEEIRGLSKSIIDKKRNELIEKADPFYKAAERNVLSDKIYEDIVLKDPVIRESLEDILKKPIYRKELEDFPAQSVKTLDLVKKDLDHKIKAAYKNGADYEAKLFTKARTNLVKNLDNISPDYKKARSIYSEDMPAIKALEDSALGKISKMSDEQLKNVSKDIFDPSVTDPKRFAQYRDEISKESPTLWNALIRQEMERTLGKEAKTAKNFHKNILQDERVFNKYIVALNGNKQAQQNLREIKRYWGNLNNEYKAKEAASSSMLSNTNLLLGAAGLATHSVIPVLSGVTLGLAKKVLNGKYDKEAIALAISGNWDIPLKEISKLPKKQRASAFVNLLEKVKETSEKHPKSAAAGRLGVQATKEPKAHEEEENEDHKMPEKEARALMKQSPALARIMKMKNLPGDKLGFERVLSDVG